MSFHTSLRLWDMLDGIFTIRELHQKAITLLSWKSSNAANLSEDQPTNLNQRNNSFLIHRDPGRFILLRALPQFILTTIAIVNHDNRNIKSPTHSRNDLLRIHANANIATAQEFHDQTLLQLLRIRDDVFTLLYYDRHRRVGEGTDLLKEAVATMATHRDISMYAICCLLLLNSVCCSSFSEM